MYAVDQDADLWKRELIAAGWRPKFNTVREAPNGALYRGPYAAWKVMKSIGCDEHDDCHQGPCKAFLIYPSHKIEV